MPIPISAPENTRNQPGSLQTTLGSDWQTSERLGDGVAFKAIDCLNGALVEVCPDPEVEPEVKTVADPDGIQTVTSFGFYESAKCSTNANADVIEETAALAMRKLDRQTSHYIESGFWAGQIATASADDVSIGTGGVGVTTALSLLLQGYTAVAGGERGIVHIPSWTVPFLDAYYLLVRNGNLLQLAGTDHLVVAGSGYPGTDPSGADPGVGFTYFYMTGAVKAFVSEPFVTANVDRSVNDIEARAERAGVAVFNPCAHLAVEVCLADPGPDCGSA